MTSKYKLFMVKNFLKLKKNDKKIFAKLINFNEIYTVKRQKIIFKNFYFRL